MHHADGPILDVDLVDNTVQIASFAVDQLTVGFGFARHMPAERVLRQAVNRPYQSIEPAPGSFTTFSLNRVVDMLKVGQSAIREPNEVYHAWRGMLPGLRVRVWIDRALSLPC